MPGTADVLELKTQRQAAGVVQRVAHSISISRGMWQCSVQIAEMTLVAKRTPSKSAQVL